EKTRRGFSVGKGPGRRAIEFEAFRAARSLEAEDEIRVRVGQNHSPLPAVFRSLSDPDRIDNPRKRGTGSPLRVEGAFVDGRILAHRRPSRGDCAKRLLSNRRACPIEHPHAVVRSPLLHRASSKRSTHYVFSRNPTQWHHRSPGPEPAGRLKRERNR